MRPFPELHAVLRTGLTFADRLIYIGGHLRPIIRFADIQMYAGLPGVAGQYRGVSEIEHPRSERVRYYDLDNFGVSRMFSSQEAGVAFEEVRVEVP